MNNRLHVRSIELRRFRACYIHVWVCSAILEYINYFYRENRGDFMWKTNFMSFNRKGKSMWINKSCLSVNMLTNFEKQEKRGYCRVLKSSRVFRSVILPFRFFSSSLLPSFSPRMCFPTPVLSVRFCCGEQCSCCSQSPSAWRLAKAPHELRREEEEEQKEAEKPESGYYNLPSPIAQNLPFSTGLALMLRTRLVHWRHWWRLYSAWLGEAHRCSPYPAGVFQSLHNLPEEI